MPCAAATPLLNFYASLHRNVSVLLVAVGRRNPHCSHKYSTQSTEKIGSKMGRRISESRRTEVSERITLVQTSSSETPETCGSSEEKSLEFIVKEEIFCSSSKQQKIKIQDKETVKQNNTAIHLLLPFDCNL
jgi:hypothetical protein